MEYPKTHAYLLPEKDVEDIVKKHPPLPNVRYMTLADMRRRGWPKSMVEWFFCTPDAYAINPICYNSAPMRLYQEDRVFQLEKTELFKERFYKFHEKREAMLATAIDFTRSVIRKK